MRSGVTCIRLDHDLPPMGISIDKRFQITNSSGTAHLVNWKDCYCYHHIFFNSISLDCVLSLQCHVMIKSKFLRMIFFGCLETVLFFRHFLAKFFDKKVANLKSKKKTYGIYPFKARAHSPPTPRIDPGLGPGCLSRHTRVTITILNTFLDDLDCFKTISECFGILLQEIVALKAN